MKRIIITAVSGCFIMFVWGRLSHMVIFAGVGFKPLPNENEVITALQNGITENGLYFFPGREFSNATPEQESVWRENFRTKPVGILVYRPKGGEPFSPGKLIIQLMFTLLCAIIITFIMSLIVASFWKRVLAISLMGAVSCFSVSVIYWNWYEFPTSFFLAQCVDQVFGFFLAGLVMARSFRNSNIALQR